MKKKNHIKKNHSLLNYFSIFAYLIECKHNISKAVKTTTYVFNKNSSDHINFLNVPTDDIISITIKERSVTDIEYTFGDSNFQEKRQIDYKLWYASTIAVLGGLSVADDVLLDSIIKTYLKKTGISVATTLMGKLEVKDCTKNFFNDIDKATSEYAEKVKAENLANRNLKKVLKESILLEKEKNQTVEEIENKTH